MKPGPPSESGARSRWAEGAVRRQPSAIAAAAPTAVNVPPSEAAARPEASYVVFAGVHFMAESADILTGPDQHVVLPDLAAGCSMADMASIEQVEDCWDVLGDAGVADAVVPVTYMNSSAAIKA